MNSCYLCHLITFLCFLVCSQTQLHFFVSFVHLFWRVNEDECLKIAGVS
jgi:hypothetical protein